MVTWSIWNIWYKDNTVIFLEISAENSTEKISLVTSNVSRKNFNFYSSKISCLKKADTEPTFGWNHQAMHSWYCTNKDQKKKKKTKKGEKKESLWHWYGNSIFRTFTTKKQNTLINKKIQQGPTIPYLCWLGIPPHKGDDTGIKLSSAPLIYYLNMCGKP